MPGPIPDLSRSTFLGPDAPNESDLYKCVHCGFCLEACPTYVETGLETESPRGRIALMKAANEGRIDVTPNVIRHWDLCIQCRACEAACPSGVPYGRLIEAAMSQAARKRRVGLLSRLVSQSLLRWVLPRQMWLILLAQGLRLYQRWGFRRALRKSGLLGGPFRTLAELDDLLPQIPSTFFRAKGQMIPPRGQRRAKVALLSGCIMPLVHGPQMNGVARVLSRNGCEVIVPSGQVCCGAINSHVGDLHTTRALARRNIDTFLATDAEAIIVASAGCSSRMKEYGHLLRDDPEYAEHAHRLVGMVKDVHEFLSELPLDPPRSRLDYRVTYQDPCHLSNTQGIRQQPRDLLHAIDGLELVELPDASMCCGAGGTYAITERELSFRVLDSKMSEVRDTNANILATANPGCFLQLQYGVRREGLPIEVRYVTDLLDEAYGLEEDNQSTHDRARSAMVG